MATFTYFAGCIVSLFRIDGGGVGANDWLDVRYSWSYSCGDDWVAVLCK